MILAHALQRARRKEKEENKKKKFHAETRRRGDKGAAHAALTIQCSVNLPPRLIQTPRRSSEDVEPITPISQAQ
jgi:hypothetical protein